MIALFRISHWFFYHKIPFIPFIIFRLNRVLFSVVLPPSVGVGKQVTFAYQGNGTVIHKRCVIGDYTYIGPSVTMGGTSNKWDVPIVGSNVYLGAGSKIIGPVIIGDDSIVGANAVVVDNIPAGEVWGGIPAKKIKDVVK